MKIFLQNYDSSTKKVNGKITCMADPYRRKNEKIIFLKKELKIKDLYRKSVLILITL